MERHWCNQHKCLFFKRGNMRGYAHPVTDESGEKLLDTEGGTVWCNEKEDQATPEQREPIVSPKSKETSDEMSKDEWAEKDRITRKSIERQKALEMAVEVAKLFGAEKATAEKIIALAKVFELYLEGKGIEKKP